MTQVKTISIPDNIDCFDKLNGMTPDDMTFSEQVRIAVGEFVDTREGDTITKYINDKLPEYDAPIEEWIKYLNAHPEHIDNIMKRHAQLGNILRGDICRSINQC
jgi:hypothetical protein